MSRNQCQPITDSAPEVWVQCDDCQGEGSIEECRGTWDDPYYCKVVTCETCGGAGGFICEAEGDQ